MDISSVDRRHFANSFVNQLPWEMLRTVLGHHGLLRSNSRERTAERIHSTINSDDPLALERFKALWDIYNNVVFFGDKAVRFYKIADERMSLLVDFIQTIEFQDNGFTQTFPLPIEQAEVLQEHYKEHNLSPFPVKVEQLADGAWCVFFSAVRYFTEQENFDEDWLQTADIGALSGYSEIIAKRNVYRQTCDFVIIRPDSGIIEVGIDHPDSNGVFSQTLIQKNTAFNLLIDMFNGLTHHLIDGDLILARPIVLFDAVREFFSSGGRIFRARFLTADGLDDHPNMTNLKTDNYREAKFFIGGKDQVDHLNPYRISMVWSRQSEGLSSYPLLHLQGSKQMLRSSSKRLHEALISNTMGLDDYRFAVSKLFDKLE